MGLGRDELWAFILWEEYYYVSQNLRGHTQKYPIFMIFGGGLEIYLMKKLRKYCVSCFNLLGVMA